MIRKPKGPRALLRLETLEDRLCPSTTASGALLAQPDATTQAQVSRAYGRLPLSFEANQGQVDSQVNFFSRGNGYSLFLTPTEALLNLSQESGTRGQESGNHLLEMQLVGSNPDAKPVGLDQLPSVSNYLIGDDPSQWHTNVPNFAKVAYQNVYPGVDLVYYGNNQQHLEYDFVLAPGANPNAIHLAFQGAQGMTVDVQGNLVLKASGGDMVEQAPVVYQTINGVRQAVAGQYVLEGNRQVGFRVGAYDATQPLVIDPTYALVYSTYLGGVGGSEGLGIAVDSSGNAYVTGEAGNGLPTQNAFQGKYGGGVLDAFVTKLNATGTGLIYSTYLGGSSDDAATGIALDSSGNVYITGATASTNFPITNAFQPSNHGGKNGWDLFVAKLNANGSGLLYSTYLGGSADEVNYQYAIATDNSGNAYVSGSTPSTDFPTTAGAYQTTFSGTSVDGFVTKLNTTLAGTQSLVYSTYLGSIGANGIAVDNQGNAYVGESVYGGDSVTELNSAGSALVYSSLAPDYINAVAVDAAGDAYATGSAGRQGIFVTKLDPAGGQLYSFFFDVGNGSTDYPNAVAVDSVGHAYVTGVTYSSTFPTVNAFQPALAGRADAFVTEIDFTQVGTASLVYSSYLGGSDLDKGYGIAVDSGGNAYVTGFTFSRNFPTTSGAYQTQFPGKSSRNAVSCAFVTKIDPPADQTIGSTKDTAPAPLASASMRALPAPAQPGEVNMNKRELAALLIGRGKEAYLMPRTPTLSSQDLPNRIDPDSVRISKPEEHDHRLSNALVHLWTPLTSAEMLDAVFARGDWLLDPFMADLA
jgi:hypothetical protein